MIECVNNIVNGLVSIIVPAYNIDSDLLRRCVGSITDQTYSQIEAIIVDDGSKPDCAKSVDEVCAGVRNVVVIHKENGGVSSARNVALSHAHGEFVTFLDSDDYLYSDRVIEDAVRLMEEYNADIAFGQVALEYPSAQVCESYGIEKPLVLASEDQIARLADFFCSYSVPHGCAFPSSLRRGIAARMIRRCLMDGIAFNQDVHYGEDSLFDYFVSKNASRVVIVDDPWYVYCQYQDSAIRTITFQEVISQAKVLHRDYCIERKNESERISNLFIRACTKEARNNADGAKAFKKALSCPDIQDAFASRVPLEFQNPKWKELLMAFACQGRSKLLFGAIKLGCILSDLVLPLTQKR